MNRLSGHISEIHSCEDLSLVKVTVSNHITLTSLFLPDGRGTGWLATGKRVNLDFKETAVIISTLPDLHISVQNRLPCIISSVKTGELLGQVDLLFNETRICSIITANACTQLNLKETDKVYALIKTNELSISPDD